MLTETITPTDTIWPTVTKQILPAAKAAGLVPCEQRQVSGDLLTIVTNQFALPSSYSPPDLVLLSSVFRPELTLNEALYVRAILVEPLRLLLNEMETAGLQPSVLSGYRSYQEQQLAWHWWESKYPDRVAIMSARPGYSEHQLGTTIDFGSPATNHLFTVDFARTPEGVWLAENAYRFGFSLSYPKGTYDITGFKHEPWHYRYVGREMAAALHESGAILTSWQLQNLPPPCIP